MNQKGFVNIILIIVVVALAGVAGYFILANRSKAPEPTLLANTQLVATPTPTPSTGNNQPVINESKQIGKFTFPAGREDFVIGTNKKIIWQMPNGENTYYTLNVDLINERGEKLGNIINWNWVKYNPIDSVNWDFSTVYNSVPSGKTPEGQTVYELKPDKNIKIQPGNYKSTTPQQADGV